MDSRQFFSCGLPTERTHSRGEGSSISHRDKTIMLVCSNCLDPVPEIREDYSSGNLVCGTCMFVLGSSINATGSERRRCRESNSDNPSRLGVPMDSFTEEPVDFETWINADTYSSKAARASRRPTARFEEYQSRLEQGYSNISSLCDTLSLPKAICDRAKKIFKYTEERDLLRGKELNGVTTVCVFIACRQGRSPRTFQEFQDCTDVPKKTLGSHFKILEQAFNAAAQSGQIDSGSFLAIKTNTAEELLPRVLNRLDLPTDLQPICESVINEARSRDIEARRIPAYICGAVILFASQLVGRPVSVKAICEIIGIASDKTLLQIHQTFVDRKHELVDTKLIKTGKIDLSRLS